MINRRRFLQIIGAVSLLPAQAKAAEWQGVAFGADVAVSLSGPGATATLAQLPDMLDGIERVFSLHRPSELTRLNQQGATNSLSPPMRQALALCDRLHHLTNGAFDPTVQPIWQALATGEDVDAARRRVGWEKVALDAGTVRLGSGQALTLNGMAQGFAADLVKAWLVGQGFQQALINLGEYAAIGGPYRMGISDPAAGLIGQRQLQPGRAFAASSPLATQVAGQPHIQHPRGLAPVWSTVAVEAASAALADGLSTALVFADRHHIAQLRQSLGDEIGAVSLIDMAGDLQTI